MAVCGFSSAQDNTRSAIFLTTPQRLSNSNVAISQPQILAVGNQQPVRTVIARPITVSRTPLAPVQLGQAQPVLNVVAPLPSEVPAEEEVQPPKPYSFSYDTEHEDGSTNRREESSDGSGTVRGSYGYRDADGLFRTVDYIADANGFRANVRSNEPGMAKASPNPANVQLEVEPVPDKVLLKYAALDLARIVPVNAPAQSTRLVSAPVVVRTLAAPLPAPVQTVRVQPIAIALQPVQPQRQQLQAIRLQTVAQSQLTPVRVIPVSGFLGSSTFQQPRSNVLFSKNIRRRQRQKRRY